MKIANLLVTAVSVGSYFVCAPSAYADYYQTTDPFADGYVQTTDPFADGYIQNTDPFDDPYSP